ncbi:hypothetical protein LCGC14_0349770 [marine sediment metagenome]|uniref:Uncharacterized protein n=1 Tax=marine sediment metagenome TaxID=412755 RepID=A0A0F9TB41_9ZZZZ
MANVGRKGIVIYEETFAVDNLGTGLPTYLGGTSQATGIAWIQNMDSGNTSFTRSVSASKGLHWAGSLDSTNDDVMEICGDQLMFYGSVGHQAIEVMLMVDQASSMAFNFGFNDEVGESSNDLPVSLQTATWQSSASTFIGIVKDFDATNDELHAFWVDDDVDTQEKLTNLRMRGMNMVADKWLWMRIETQSLGSGQPIRATFHAVHNGKHWTSEFDTTVDGDQALCWSLNVMNKAGIARGVFVKLPYWEQSIAD